MIRDWTCNCGKVTKLKVPTTKQSLTCRVCGRKYWITGTHIDGRPMTRELAGDHRKTDQNRLISALQEKATGTEVDTMPITERDHQVCQAYGYKGGAKAKFFRHGDGCVITFCKLNVSRKAVKRV